MARIRLIVLDADTIPQLLDRGEEFEAQFCVRFDQARDWAFDVAKQTAALLAKSPREAPWGGYLVADADSSLIVGTCAFTHAPTSEGTVEIAYFTFPPFEGLGYATAMAAELTAIARASPFIRQVIAFTLPEPNASTRVLTKNGFRNAGLVLHPDDGRVWRWECAGFG